MVPLLIWAKSLERKRNKMDDLKKALRHKALQVRGALSPEERESANQRITELFVQTEMYQKCKRLLLYASYGSEADTYAIFEQALMDEKQVYFPKVVGMDLIFYQVHSKENLKPGYRGIPEPDEVAGSDSLSFGKQLGQIWSPVMAQDTLLVYPGVAFDRNHNRLGYGKGFYDRFTARCRAAGQVPENLALAYVCQIVDAIPVQEQDEKPNRILTENGFVYHGNINRYSHRACK